MTTRRPSTLDRRALLAGCAVGAFVLAEKAAAFSIVDAPETVRGFYALSACGGGEDHAALLDDVLGSLTDQDPAARDAAVLTWACPLCGCRAAPAEE